MNVEAISIDFWDTLIIRTLDAQSLRLKVCHELVKEFALELSAEGLLKMHNDMGRGLTTIARDLGYDREYVLENAWYLIGSGHLFDHNLSSKFASRAVQIELILTKKFTKKNHLLLFFLGYLGKKRSITLISDFEGSSFFLAEILKFHGVDQKYEILVSSSVLYRKSTGNLFRCYLDRFPNNHPKRLMHLGDNLESDYRQPKKLSIRSFWLPRVRYSSKYGVRVLRKIRSIRLGKFSSKSDLAIASKILSNFLEELKTIAEKSNRVYYIGSEGAFLSQLAWDKIPNEQICLNFGRKNVLESLAGSRIKYVFSRMILENCNISELISFFQLKNEESSDLLFKSLIFSPQQIDFTYIQESISENSSRAIKHLKNLNFQDRDLFVDVGYKGTFVRALTLHSNKNFNYLQIFGNKAECSDFSHNWTSIFQSDDRGFDSYFRINTKMVEILFSDGPRAPIKNEIVEHFVNSLNFEKFGQVKNLAIHKFFNSPSCYLARGLNKITHTDDIKNPVSRELVHGDKLRAVD